MTRDGCPHPFRLLSRAAEFSLKAETDKVALDNSREALCSAYANYNVTLQRSMQLEVAAAFKVLTNNVILQTWAVRHNTDQVQAILRRILVRFSHNMKTFRPDRCPGRMLHKRRLTSCSLRRTLASRICSLQPCDIWHKLSTTKNRFSPGLTVFC